MVRVPDFESEIPRSIPALTTCWVWDTVIPTFNSFTTLVNRELVSLPSVGILKGAVSRNFKRRFSFDSSQDIMTTIPLENYQG